jgi:hypothetical protein
MRSFIIYTFIKYYYSDQFKEDEMGGVCSSHGEMKTECNIRSENLKGENHLEDLGVKGG